jgi:hypothetical protein
LVVGSFAADTLARALFAAMMQATAAKPGFAARAATLPEISPTEPFEDLQPIPAVTNSQLLLAEPGASAGDLFSGG